MPGSLIKPLLEESRVLRFLLSAVPITQVVDPVRLAVTRWTKGGFALLMLFWSQTPCRSLLETICPHIAGSNSSDPG